MIALTLATHHALATHHVETSPTGKAGRSDSHQLRGGSGELHPSRRGHTLGGDPYPLDDRRYLTSTPKARVTGGWGTGILRSLAVVSAASEGLVFCDRMPRG